MTETPGHLLKKARKRHGVSQKRLAIRAGTTQSAISRIESDRISPSVETLRELLFLIGEDLALSSNPRDWGIDRSLVQERLKRTPEERVGYAIAFADQVIAISPNVRREDRAV